MCTGTENIYFAGSFLHLAIYAFPPPLIEVVFGIDILLLNNKKLAVILKIYVFEKSFCLSLLLPYIHTNSSSYRTDTRGIKYRGQWGFLRGGNPPSSFQVES